MLKLERKNCIHSEKGIGLVLIQKNDVTCWINMVYLKQEATLLKGKMSTGGMRFCFLK